MFRDWAVCWLLSIGFEVRGGMWTVAVDGACGGKQAPPSTHHPSIHPSMPSPPPFPSSTIGAQVLECSLQFIIPEFKECWWDSLLIDLLGKYAKGRGEKNERGGWFNSRHAPSPGFVRPLRTWRYAEEEAAATTDTNDGKWEGKGNTHPPSLPSLPSPLKTTPTTTTTTPTTTGANLLGMAAGWATLQAYAETHAFDWSGTQCSSQGRLRRLVNRWVGGCRGVCGRGNVFLGGRRDRP